MSQALFKSKGILAGSLIVAVLLTAQVWARSSPPPPEQPVPVQNQPAEAHLRLEAAFCRNSLIGTVTVSSKDGRPWMEGRGQAHILDASGQQQVAVPLQPLGLGEFRLIAPLGGLDAPGYLDVRVPGRDIEQRAIYQIDRDQRTVTWVEAVPDGNGPLADQATGGPDQFGYTWDDTATYSWINTSDGTSVTLRDDEWVGPFPIGFTFNFYGQNHTQFYLDSNGYIGFDDTQTASYYGNTELPYVHRPNNLVAPFWDDFDPSQGGTVRYRTFGASPSRYLVVEWSGVPLWGTSDAQSFQLILYEGTNDIKFQYPSTRQGDRGDRSYATVGIEDEDGTIGLEYPYIIPIDVNRAVRFDYNRPAYNVFLTPERQGSSAGLEEAASFRLKVKNLGSSNESFVMSRPTYTGRDWSVSFYEADGRTPLSGNSTGTIAAGGEKEIVAQVQVPSSATVGQWTRATIRARSQQSSSVYHEVTLDAMASTSFVQIYTDDYSGDGTEDSEVYLDMVQAGHRYTKRLTTDQYDYGWVGVATTPDNNIVSMWDTDYYNGTASVSEIYHAVLNRSGGYVCPVTRLTDNSGATEATYDFSPAADVAPNGNIAFGWGRQPDTYNVRYAVVSSSCGVVSAPAALTHHTGDYPRAYPPSVAALTNNRFLLAWEQAASSSQVDIYYAVLNNNGSVYKSATRLTDGTGRHYTPRVAALPDGKAAIGWMGHNTYDYLEIYYATMDGSGTVTVEPTPVTSNGNSGSDSYYVDLIGLSDGRLGLAWTQISGDDLQIEYTIVNPQPPSAPETPVLNAISNPDGDGNYTVSWNEADRADTYALQEDDNSAFPSPVTRYSGPSTSWNATDKAAGTYYYRVRASNTGGHSGWSNIQSVSVQQPQWVTLVNETFEGSFPGVWDVFDNDGASNGEYYWVKQNCASYGGSYSGWAVGDGADGASLSCGSDYPHNTDSWMVYGPFSLADATAGDLSFKLWLNSESGFDVLCRSASINGSNFYGACTSGSTSGDWIDRVLDLADVYELGNLMGQPEVWVALMFQSDGSINYSEGAYVDNIVLRKYTSAMFTGISGAASGSDNDQIVEFPVHMMRVPDPVRAADNLPHDTSVVSGPTFYPADATQTIHTVPNDLSNANISVSLTTDEDDNLIMTWLDNDGAQYLFYALADSSGTIRTEATVFQRTRHSEIWSSWNGYGNDMLEPAAGPTGPYIVCLPAVMRDYPPPPENKVENGGIESGDFSGWTVGGDESGLMPQVVTSQRHSGSYAAVLGQENAACQSGQGGLVGGSWIYQDITVPDSGSPQLTLYYRILTYDKLNADEFDRFEVYINGTLLDRLGNTSSNYGCSDPINDLGWQPFTYDLSAYRGQTIRLRLVNTTHPDDWYSTWTYVDDVEVTR